MPDARHVGRAFGAVSRAAVLRSQQRARWAALIVNPAWSSYKDAFSSEPAYWATLGLDAVHIRANLLPADKVLEEAAMDKYAFIRDAWRQRRRSQVYDRNPPAEPRTDRSSFRQDGPGPRNELRVPRFRHRVTNAARARRRAASASRGFPARAMDASITEDSGR